MRRGVFLLAAALAIAAIPPIAPIALGQPELPTEFTFTGSGYGHGIGMSQIGARGQALEGKSAIDIIKYYYPGTEVTPYPDNAMIRVNIGNQLSTATLSIVGKKGNFSLFVGDLKFGETGQPIGSYGGDFTAIFNNSPDGIVPLLTSPTAKLAPFTPAKAWTLRWETGTVINLKTPSVTRQYAYGQINIKRVVTPITNYMAITNTLRLHDEYLWGLGEMPSSWPTAALEAQAIAARTYALLKLNRIRAECDCQIYNSTNDQVFVGFSKESEPIYGEKWKQAVNNTFVDDESALTVTLNGAPINAFYFSSSAGKTQNIKEVWRSEFSYLQGVPDPWSMDVSLNPRFINWVRKVPQLAMAQAFSLPDVMSYTIDERTSTGSVSKITGYSSAGRKSTISGEAFKSLVKLPSSWFALVDPIPPAPFEDYSCPPRVLLKNLVCALT